MNNIIKTYKEYLKYQGKELQDGIDEINLALGRNIDRNYINHMAVASKPVNAELKRYLVDQCFEFSAKQHKFRNMKRVRMFLDSLESPRK